MDCPKQEQLSKILPRQAAEYFITRGIVSASNTLCGCALIPAASCGVFPRRYKSGFSLNIVICRLSLLVFTLFFCVNVPAEEFLRAKAKGDRINVRVRPNADSEIVTQLSLGEDVIVVEKGDEWTKINAPAHSACWIHSGCMDKDVIKTDSVNLRCGPGLAYPVLGKLNKGAKIKIIEVFGEWVKIEPPVNSTVYVSSKYLNYEDPEEEEKKEEVGEQQEETEKEEMTAEPSPEVPNAEEETYIAVKEEETGSVELVSYAGHLEDLGVIINRPGTYKLVSDDGKWLAIIKSPAIDVNPYVNRIVRVEGVILSKKSSWGAPVVELKRLRVIK